MADHSKKGSPEESFKTLAFDFSTIRALQESTSRYRTLFNSASDAIFVFDMQGRMLDVNRVACEQLGYSRKEIMTMTQKQITSPENVEQLADQMEALEKQRQSIFETSYQTREGQDIPIEASCRVIAYDNNQAVLTIARDITERKIAEKEKASLQAQLQQSQKMHAIGTLAGGIAHDFNNILTAIIGYSEVSKLKVMDNPDATESLDEVLQAAGRAKMLVKQILSFSRQSNHEMQPLSVVPLLKEVLKLLRASLPTTIEIKQNVDPDTGIVQADSTQIHQVIMNLCTNAAHAMHEKGGVLEVSVKNVALNEKIIAGHKNMKPGAYMQLTISDTGHGIPDDIIDAIFDPYFTTKTKGEGTGLGLSVVHGIVKNHGGIITVRSELDVGTAFDVYLPLTEGKTDTASEGSSTVLKGKEHILFIDDEQNIVNVVKAILGELGYRLSAYLDPGEALQYFKQNPDEVDLIITDMTMPGLTGEELAQEIWKIKPGMPMILCTGFSTQMSEDRARQLGFKKFMMKPLSVTGLSRVVREVLDMPGPA